MTTNRLFIASAVLLSTSLFAGCDDYSLFRDSDPGVYKGRSDVHQEVDPEKHRNQLRKRLWATQGETPWGKGL